MAHSAQEQPNHSVMELAAKRIALNAGSEDLTGLWELIWEMRQEFPTADDEHLRQVARGAMVDLIEYRLVRLVWWNPETNAETSLTHDASISVLDDPHNWNPPEGRNPVHIRFLNTPSGDRAYYAGLVAPR